jgi:photosystem I subunit VIII
MKSGFLNNDKGNNTNFYIKKSMISAYLPSFFVPLVCLVFPAIAMAFLFVQIEKEEIV